MKTRRWAKTLTRMTTACIEWLEAGVKRELFEGLKIVLDTHEKQRLKFLIRGVGGDTLEGEMAVSHLALQPEHQGFSFSNLSAVALAN